MNREHREKVEDLLALAEIKMENQNPEEEILVLLLKALVHAVMAAR